MTSGGRIAAACLVTASLAGSLAYADERTRKLAARLPEEAALFVREATKVAEGEETLHPARAQGYGCRNSARRREGHLAGSHHRVALWICLIP